MVICDFGDVAVVPFPFVDRPIAKKRPALVLSREAFNTENGQTVFAMITTGARSSWPSDLAIDDSASAGLRHLSNIRWKVFTLPNLLVLRTIGSLGKGDRARVSQALSTIFPAA